jgi:two-component system, NtrC family, response regulator GlrR
MSTADRKSNRGGPGSHPSPTGAKALEHIVGEDARFVAAKDRLRTIAESDAPVLILGETGTGKGVFARAVHYLSSRRGGPFVPVNCGAIPVDLVENELFGHERSAYTGAADSYAGLVAEAERGTLFLDEVDALPAQAQVKLLRLLEEREYRRLGSASLRRADVRVVAATNSEVVAQLEDGRFRRDLFYRLDVLQLDLPPLRERRCDIALLAARFLERYSRRESKRLERFSAEAMQRLSGHTWPGNVRELQNAVQRAVILAKPDQRIMEVHHLEIHGPESTLPESFRAAKQRAIKQFERSYVESMLACCGGNISQAARVAKKDRRAFWELIRKHSIDVARFR